jgi:hypothetical protein
MVLHGTQHEVGYTALPPIPSGWRALSSVHVGMPPQLARYVCKCIEGAVVNQARSQAWANPGSARVAHKTARVAQMVEI